MKMLLYHEENKVASFDLIPYIRGFSIKNACVLENTLLPISVKMYLKHGFTEEIALYQWLIEREVPDYRIDIDKTLCETYHIPFRSIGSMYGTQHTAAILYGWTSMFDKYSIYPEKTENLSYIQEDQHFWAIYRLLPKNIIDNKLKSDWKDFTIHSALPSKWEIRDDKYCLFQSCWEWQRETFEKKAGKIREYGINIKSLENGFLTDFSFVKDTLETLWLSECIPLLSGNNTQEEILTLLPDTESKELARKLLALECNCEKENIPISINELGILTDRKNEKHLIAML